MNAKGAEARTVVGTGSHSFFFRRDGLSAVHGSGCVHLRSLASFA